jgi:hypothetical protein
VTDMKNKGKAPAKDVSHDQNVQSAMVNGNNKKWIKAKKRRFDALGQGGEKVGSSMIRSVGSPYRATQHSNGINNKGLQEKLDVSQTRQKHEIENLNEDLAQDQGVVSSKDEELVTVQETPSHGEEDMHDMC